MRTLIVIPARLAAVRLPQKPLRLLGGAPLVARVWQRVSEMNIADGVSSPPTTTSVARSRARSRRRSSDDQQRACIGNRSRRRGRVDAGIRRLRQRSSTFRATSRSLDGGHRRRGEQGQLGALSARYLGLAGIMGHRRQSQHREGRVGNDGRALYFSRAGIPFVRDRDAIGSSEIQMLQHIGVYAYSRDALRKWVTLPHTRWKTRNGSSSSGRSRLEFRLELRSPNEPPASGIDTEDDLAAANARWQEFIAGR